MYGQFEKNPGLPQGFAKKFREMVKPKDFAELTVHAYALYVDDADLDAAIAFYETPSGKKIADSQGKIAEDVVKHAEKWGMEMGMKVALELQKEKKDDDTPKKGTDKDDE